METNNGATAAHSRHTGTHLQKTEVERLRRSIAGGCLRLPLPHRPVSCGAAARLCCASQACLRGSLRCCACALAALRSALSPASLARLRLVTLRAQASPPVQLIARTHLHLQLRRAYDIAHLHLQLRRAYEGAGLGA